MKAEKKVRECGCHGLGQPIKKERRPKLRELSAVLQYPDPNYKYYIQLFYKLSANPLFIGFSNFIQSMQR